ncbi:hypothetical protein Sste5346_007003 [Sporothrix stenoceras]|uniref:C6 zinc finger domain containing protein n=1 Tax=Sporothrix stenoceras TaxID=5173 RepID=A0ABR3YVS5_9PEZI
MADTYYGWTPPSVDDALFVDSNCGIAAQWLSAYVNSLYNGTDLSDPPLLVSYQYLSALVPEDGEVPTFGQAAQWFADGTANSSLYDQMVQFPYDFCPVEICEKLVWEGDGDLAGIGVMVVYYLAAIFATMYFVLLAADQFEPFRRFEHHYRRWNWVVGAFHETVQAFLDTGLIFCISMLISGVYRFGSARLHPDKSHSVYQLTNAAYIGMFTICPPVILQIVSPNRRRRRIRAVLWLVVLIMSIVLMALYYSLETSATKLLNLLDRQSAVSDLIWEANCEPLTLRENLDVAIITSIVIIGVNVFPWAYHIFIPRPWRHSIRKAVVGRWDSTRKGRFGRSWWKHVVAIVRTVDGVCCCIIMWALLGLFTAYRSVVLKAMGPENANTEWSFAQVFALATWVPVAIDLCTIYIYGAQEGLEGKVSENFKVVENHRKDSDGSSGGGGTGYDGPSDVDYANLDPYQVVPAQTNSTNGNYDAVNNGTQMQYVASGGQFSDVQYNNGVFNNGMNNNGNVMQQYTTYDNTQYGAGGAGIVGNVQQYDPQTQQYAPQQYTTQQYTTQQYSPSPQYDPSMTKEAVAAAEAQPMAQYMQPAPYNSNTVSTVHTTGNMVDTASSIHSGNQPLQPQQQPQQQPVTYGYMPQDPATMHGGVHQQ